MPQSRQPKRILLISDHDAYCRYLGQRFAQAGFVVDAYADAQQALESINRGDPPTADSRPWLAILDGSLYAIRGARLIEKLFRACGRQIPVFVINCEQSTAEFGPEWKKLGVKVVLSPTPADENMADAIFKCGQVYWRLRQQEH